MNLRQFLKTTALASGGFPAIAAALGRTQITHVPSGKIMKKFRVITPLLDFWQIRKVILLASYGG
jgi:hypothetical protein